MGPNVWVCPECGEAFTPSGSVKPKRCPYCSSETVNHISEMFEKKPAIAIRKEVSSDDLSPDEVKRLDEQSASCG